MKCERFVIANPLGEAIQSIEVSGLLHLEGFAMTTLQRLLFS